MLVKELKYGDGIELDFSATEIKKATVFIRRSQRDYAVKVYIDADKSIPINGIRTCQDGQTKGEQGNGTDHGS